MKIIHNIRINLQISFYIGILFLMFLRFTWSTENHISKQTNSSSLTAPNAQVLIFHKTNGYRHSGAINKGIELIEDLGDDLGWTTDNSTDPAVFNASNLANYDLVIWHNTSGNNLLDSTQQQAFEDYIYGDGAFMGIHAATDTYRDKSWPFYNELVGAIVQTSPNHTSNGYNADMEVLNAAHPSVNHLDSIWNKNEEYYYWELNGGQLSNDNNHVLFVDTTGSNSYDLPRPMAWYKKSIMVDSIRKPVRSFYTALGHNQSDYTNNVDFQDHIKGAITWCICLGEEKIWDGTNWTPTGTPTSDDKVILNGNYNTSTNGPLEACSIRVNSNYILVADGSNKIIVEKRMYVDGILEIINHGEIQMNDQ